MKFTSFLFGFSVFVCLCMRAVVHWHTSGEDDEFGRKSSRSRSHITLMAPTFALKVIKVACCCMLTSLFTQMDHSARSRSLILSSGLLCLRFPIILSTVARPRVGLGHHLLILTLQLYRTLHFGYRGTLTGGR